MLLGEFGGYACACVDDKRDSALDQGERERCDVAIGEIGVKDCSLDYVSVEQVERLFDSRDRPYGLSFNLFNCVGQIQSDERLVFDN